MNFKDLLLQLNSAEFSSLRPMQESVLEQYNLLLNSKGEVLKKDVAIEMPAGTGKTLAALLIAEFHRRLNKPVVILTGTRQLAKQVAEDANYLGVNISVFEGPGADWSQRDLLKYRNAETIAIMNYWAYFNTNPRPSPAEILIFDDAHLAENAISGLFSICIERDKSKELFLNIIKAINSLRPGRYTIIEDILKDGIIYESCFLLPFTDWLILSKQITQYLNDEDDDSVRFVWPQIRNKSDALALYITSNEIQIRPLIYPTQTLLHFSKPKQRIYLSATLGDSGDFQRRIGCDYLHVIRPSDPKPGERGRRMIILFPSKEDEDGNDEVIEEGLRILWPVARKRLWMCSSWREVEKWKEKIPPLKNGSKSHIFELKGSDETQLEEFRKSGLGHLFTAARYDGMDFPGDQCRLAFIPSPPITSDPQEEFFSTCLRDAVFLKSRFSQRVAQALGRCNREPADFAVYICLDPRFERKFGGNDPDYLAYLPPDIQAEIEAALGNSEDGFEACCMKAKDFLSGVFTEWDALVKKSVRDRKLQNVSFSSEIANYEVTGWLALWNGDPTKAAQKFKECKTKYERQHLSGPLAFSRYCCAWAKYICYYRQIDPKALEDTISFLENSASPGPSFWFTTTLRAVANDLREHLEREIPPPKKIDYYKEAIISEWERILYERGTKEAVLKKYFDKIEEDITSGSHDQVTDGIEKLGKFIGFEAFRPRQSGMPDVIWRFSRESKLIFTWEVKAELANDRKISLKDINQAHGYGRWAENNYLEDGYQCIPLVLSCSGDLEPEAKGRLDNIRCITQITLNKLFKSVRDIFDSFKIMWNVNDSKKSSQAKQKVYSKIPSINWLLEVFLKKKSGFISEIELLSDWKIK